MCASTKKYEIFFQNVLAKGKAFGYIYSHGKASRLPLGKFTGITIFLLFGVKTMSNFLSIINKPTAAAENGSYKRGNWATYLRESILNNTIIINETDGKITLNETELSFPVCLGMALEPVFSGGYSEERLSTFLDYQQKEVLSKLQANTQEKEGLSDFFANVQTGRTADEYRRSIFRENCNRDNAGALETIILEYMGLPEKSQTKANFKELLDKVSLILFPDEKQKAYAAMADQEKKDAEQWESLTSAGFERIRKVDGTENISAFLPFAKVSEAMPALMECGFGPVGRPVPADDMTGLIVVFSAIKQAEKLA